jgi:hypothetical protein
MRGALGLGGRGNLNSYLYVHRRNSSMKENSREQPRGFLVLTSLDLNDGIKVVYNCMIIGKSNRP